MQKLLLTNAVEESTYTALTHTGSAVVTRDYDVLLSWDVSSYLYPLSSPEQEFISGVSNAAPLPSANAGVSNHPFPSLITCDQNHHKYLLVHITCTSPCDS